MVLLFSARVIEAEILNMFKNGIYFLSRQFHILNPFNCVTSVSNASQKDYSCILTRSQADRKQRSKTCTDDNRLLKCSSKSACFHFKTVGQWIQSKRCFSDKVSKVLCTIYNADLHVLIARVIKNFTSCFVQTFKYQQDGKTCRFCHIK